MALAIDRSTASPTRALAAFSADLSYSDLSTEVIQRTKDLMLDFLGVALRGATTDSAATMARLVAELSPDGPSSVIGYAQSAAPQYAALVNGTSSHSIEMDDVTTTSSLHPGVSAFPAALALAEELDAPPRDVITAVVAGYEVIMRVGDAINGSEAYKVGFHPTAVRRSRSVWRRGDRRVVTAPGRGTGCSGPGHRGQHGRGVHGVPH
jgi:2-methylcitrate dehydratase PrpD